MDTASQMNGIHKKYEIRRDSLVSCFNANKIKARHKAKANCITGDPLIGMMQIHTYVLMCVII